MISSPWRYLIVNSLGTLGYLSIVIQWTWCLITLGHPLLSADIFATPPPSPSPSSIHSPMIDPGLFAPFVPLFAVLVTILVITLTVITLIRLPRTVGKKGAELTHVIATQIVKKAEHRHRMTPKKRVQVSVWITWILKIVAIYVPFALVFATPAVEDLSSQLITLIGFTCAAFSTLYFTLQLLLSFILKLDTKKVW
jgi:hypothetical protein